MDCKTLFKKALVKMVKENRFEDCIKYAKGREKREIKRLYETLKRLDDGCGIENMPIIPLLAGINSTLVFCEVFMLMLGIESEVNE